jgi:hypothetical protein
LEKGEGVARQTSASFEGSLMTEGKKGRWGDICSGRRSEIDWPEGLVWLRHFRLLHPGVDPVSIGPARLRRRVLKKTVSQQKWV